MDRQKTVKQGMVKLNKNTQNFQRYGCCFIREASNLCLAAQTEWCRLIVITTYNILFMVGGRERGKAGFFFSIGNSDLFLVLERVHLRIELVRCI